jgi:lipopolysaccharide export system protein LptA
VPNVSPCRPSTLSSGLTVLALAAGVAVGVPAPARAEKADRDKPLVIEADQPGTVDLARRVVVFAGNVVLTQGTLRIRANRLELREGPDGQREAAALGADGAPADFREKREGLNEFVEGRARRIDYDSRSDVLKLEGQAQVRRLRGEGPNSEVADEITGERITWDNSAEFFRVQAAPGSAGAPAGRVRAVIAPPRKP